MKKYLVLVETEGGQLPKKNGDYLDFSGDTVVGEYEAESIEMAQLMGKKELREWGLDGDYNFTTYPLSSKK